MRLILFVLLAVATVASFYFDFRWKKWMAQKRDEREHDGDVHYRE